MVEQFVPANSIEAGEDLSFYSDNSNILIGKGVYFTNRNDFWLTTPVINLFVDSKNNIRFETLREFIFGKNYRE